MPVRGISSITLTQARKIALRAQGFMGSVRTIDQALARTRLLQLDSVNVVERAHYLPIYSRIGAYNKAILDQKMWSDDHDNHLPQKPGVTRCGFTEYWAHEAAVIPFHDWPAFRWRMQEYHQGRWHVQEDRVQLRAQLADQICRTVTEFGPATAGEIEKNLGLQSPGTRGAWWDRGETKIVCESLFAAGVLATAKRTHFQRYYDLVENVVPREFREVKLTREESLVHLVANACTSLGIATEADISDYYRVKMTEVRPALQHLVARGEVEEVRVDGWNVKAYLSLPFSIPRTSSARALLCPFDPLIFFRPRLERLFSFHYRIEIYTPAQKRKYGYYVFPFLLGDRCVARVDLKADRTAGCLLIQGAYLEEHATTLDTAEPLAASVREMAEWLGLSGVRVLPTGDLAPALRRIFSSHE